MPVLPKEEEAGSNLTDRVAKESKDSTASSHEHHNTDKVKATVQDHQATPGIVIADNLGQPESKEALKKRAEELNK
ncbi:Hypothetical protein R9X50_00076100 [Acrodontium crateriforme]|uniref:Uncharacterized protein n=1 Tax=Acrodontium crateriforme TaxID=150365 RepID=A0AAQ3LXX0_9PEZI|nr:Hypothetical protein R9X50_00076100 [Acrodontium crateriforme]